MDAGESSAAATEEDVGRGAFGLSFARFLRWAAPAMGSVRPFSSAAHLRARFLTPQQKRLPVHSTLSPAAAAAARPLRLPDLPDGEGASAAERVVGEEGDVVHAG
jgi:hypothetical protein